ncbi:hypothetical protein Scep_002249 [Stephania cephalantha]|uniref:Uncharacterized protein n=1 Tax=Stephania cephalantha TaxID=152367 RepID=A0AAP0LAV4_9MAGN
MKILGQSHASKRKDEVHTRPTPLAKSIAQSMHKAVRNSDWHGKTKPKTPMPTASTKSDLQGKTKHKTLLTTTSIKATPTPSRLITPSLKVTILTKATPLPTAEYETACPSKKVTGRRANKTSGKGKQLLVSKVEDGSTTTRYSSRLKTMNSRAKAFALPLTSYKNLYIIDDERNVGSNDADMHKKAFEIAAMSIATRDASFMSRFFLIKHQLHFRYFDRVDTSRGLVYVYHLYKLWMEGGVPSPTKAELQNALEDMHDVIGEYHLRQMGYK